MVGEVVHGSRAAFIDIRRALNSMHFHALGGAVGGAGGPRARSSRCFSSRFDFPPRTFVRTLCGSTFGFVRWFGYPLLLRHLRPQPLQKVALQPFCLNNPEMLYLCLWKYRGFCAFPMIQRAPALCKARPQTMECH